MPRKPIENQSLARRKPAQERALEKVELILEAATRIIHRDGLKALTTNRIAEVAGISIGTLYQYFPDKQAILVELSQRELKGVMAKLVANLQAGPGLDAQARSRFAIHAVFGAFGGRSRVHRELLDMALARGNTELLDRSPDLIANLLTSTPMAGAAGQHRPLTPAEAFVMTQAFVGVTRAWLRRGPDQLPREDIEQALSRLMQTYLRSLDEDGPTAGGPTAGAPTAGAPAPPCP